MTTQIKSTPKALALMSLFAILFPLNAWTGEAQATETFSVGNMALNTNSSYEKVNGHPRMTIYQRSASDSDQYFDRQGKLLRHGSTGKCLNARNTGNGTQVNVFPCNSKDPDQNWDIVTVNGANLIRRTGTNLCVDAPSPRASKGRVHLWECVTTNPSQRWVSSSLTSSQAIVGRGKAWVNMKVPYSMSAWDYPDGRKALKSVAFESYRTDCSGFVSMAWNLPESAVTSSLIKYAKPLSKLDELLPGDAINNRGIGGNGHVVLFVSWANKAQGLFNAYEQVGGSVRKAQATQFTIQSKGTTTYSLNGRGTWYLERKK